MDATAGMGMINRMIDLHQHLADFDIEAGAEGYYLPCYCGNGASGEDIAQGLSKAVAVEVKVVGAYQGQKLLGVFLTKPPRQLQASEVKQHVIWGELNELKAEFADCLKGE